jgi:succinate dehydrogenase/fumarate reductase flavoprotein subunit
MRSQIPSLPQQQVENEKQRVSSLRGIQGKYTPLQLMRRLQKTMWECAGPVRDEKRLVKAESILEEIEAQTKNLRVSSISKWNEGWVDALELYLMLPVARMVIHSSKARTESRGAHIRLDYPHKEDDHALSNMVVKKSPQGLHLWKEAVSFSRLHPRDVVSQI